MRARLLLPLAALLALLSAAGAVAAAAPADTDRAAVAWEAEPAEAFAGQPVRLRLRVLVEEGFLGNLLPFSLRRLDLPVQVEAAWPEGTGAGSGASGEGTASLSVNAAVVRARRAGTETRGERRFAVFVVERPFSGTAGTVALPAPVLRCAWAERFGEDALGGRVPMDRFEGSVVGEAASLRILPLPEEGRPAGFGGAVGRFTVAASLPGEERPGPPRAEVRVALRIEGEGNLAAFDPPPFPATAGLHLLGVRDDGGSPVRTVVYDLSRTGPAEAVPPIPLPFFDPGAEGGGGAGWKVAATEPLPLPRWDPPPGGEAAPEAPKVSEEDTLATTLLLFLLLLAPVVLLPILFRPRRRAAGGAAGTAAPAGAAGARAGGARLADPAADPEEVLVAFLAGRLGVLPAAVVSPDLRRRLEAAGAPADRAARTADLVDRLVGARYGGPPVADGAARVRDLLEEWEGGGSGAGGPR